MQDLGNDAERLFDAVSIHYSTIPSAKKDTQLSNHIRTKSTNMIIKSPKVTNTGHGMIATKSQINHLHQSIAVQGTFLALHPHPSCQ